MCSLEFKAPAQIRECENKEVGRIRYCDDVAASEGATG